MSSHAMRVREWQGEIVFLHEVASGAADRSYGIHVARLAGLPEGLLARAEQVLTQLEKGEQGNRAASLAGDLPLFAVMEKPVAPAAPDPAQQALVKALEDIQPDTLSPREALNILYELKSLQRSE